MDISKLNHSALTSSRYNNRRNAYRYGGSFTSEYPGLHHPYITRPGSNYNYNDGTDENFIVIVSNSENQYPFQTEFRKIDSTDTFRTIEIPLKDGYYMIQIIGTFVIPEFGTIAQLVLIIAIISIITITAKTRYRFNNF